MGIPVAIIVMIALMMGMFAVFAVIIFMKKEKIFKQTIDPAPKKEEKEND